MYSMHYVLQLMQFLLRIEYIYFNIYSVICIYLTIYTFYLLFIVFLYITLIYLLLYMNNVCLKLNATISYI